MICSLISGSNSRQPLDSSGISGKQTPGGDLYHPLKNRLIHITAKCDGANLHPICFSLIWQTLRKHTIFRNLTDSVFPIRKDHNAVQTGFTSRDIYFLNRRNLLGRFTYRAV